MTRRFASIALCILIAGCERPAGRAPDTAAGASAATASPLPFSGPVTDTAFGPLRIGMTVAEARTAIPGFRVPAGAETSGCDYATVAGTTRGLRVMIEAGRVVRVEVDTSTVATGEGARVGASEESIKKLYGSRLTVSPHKYTDGHYLTVRSTSPADTVHRLVFETDGARVTRYRAGQMPQVAWVEGCS